MTHFTYNDAPDIDELCQGDILEKTATLNNVLKEVHPHYARSEYTHFQVLTQGCDLVLRGSGKNKKCKSRYITLAAVRSLDTVISRHIASFPQEDKLKIGDKLLCSTKRDFEIKDNINKIINNNHKDYFYLEAYPDAGLINRSCTFLHLSIAIKSELHYQTCLEAKRIQLNDNFQSKLGWMVGNLYSRVGTVDYNAGAELNSEEMAKLIDDIMKDHVILFPQDRFTFARKGSKSIIDIDELITYTDQQITKAKEKRFELLASAIVKALDLPDENKSTIKSALINNPNIAPLIS